MSELCTEKSATRERYMSDVAEASALLKLVSGEPRWPVKAAIGRAFDRVSAFLPPTKKMRPSRIEDIWRQEARTVQAYEMDAIRAAKAAREQKESRVRADAARLGTIFAGVAERLQQIDPNFHGDDIAALVGAARQLGAVDSAVAEAGEALGLSDAPAGKGAGE